MHRDVLIPDDSQGTDMSQLSFPRSRRGRAVIERYGADFIAARAREGLVRKEIEKVAHPERLTPDEVAAIRRQVMRRQAALMRAVRAAKRVSARGTTAGEQ